ncbi:MAG: phosphatase PAP2 family protein [Erysipelotrichaceae bacterium]|nr:phosphatase PAP2 family protein [Erysipelotrichaceae bacterium]
MEFLLWLQQIQNPFLDFIFEAITLLFNEFILVGLLCYLYWCANKKLAQKIALSYFLSGTMIQIMKLHFRIPRPWILDERIQPKPSMKETATGYSFPSGHTQTATSGCYSVLSELKNRKWKIFFIILPLLMMLSRMYVRVHTPLDVSVAFLVSVLCVLFIHNYLKKNETNRLLHLSLFTMILSFLGLGYTFYLTYYEIAPVILAKDSVKMLGAAIGFSLGCILETKYLNYDTDDTRKKQIIIMIFGLLGALVFQAGLKLIFPQFLVFDTLRYFITMLWIVYIYPLIIMKIIRK